MSTAQHQVDEKCLYVSVLKKNKYSISHLKLCSLSLSFKFSRADKTLQDIVYKLVPGLFKGKTSYPGVSS